MYMYNICMRVARTFTIEEHLIKKLNSSGNRSELINRILTEYFDKEDLNQMNIKQLTALKEIRKLEREHDKKVEEVRKNGNR